MKEEKITMLIQKQNPKNNPTHYKFSTVEEMFSFLTTENIDRFLAEISSGIKAAVLMRDIVNSIDNKQPFDLKSLTWIDD